MHDDVRIGVWVYATNGQTVVGFKTTTMFKGQSVGTAVTNAVLDGLNLDPRAKRKVYKWSSSAGSPVGKPLHEKKVRLQKFTMLAVVLQPKKHHK